jgi:hypothetical protein
VGGHEIRRWTSANGQCDPGGLDRSDIGGTGKRDVAIAHPYQAVDHPILAGIEGEVFHDVARDRACIADAGDEIRQWRWGGRIIIATAAGGHHEGDTHQCQR